MNDNPHCRWLLTSIREAATNPYDKWDGVDNRYAFALGMIAGICTEAMQAVDEDRPVRVELASIPAGRSQP